MPTEPKGSRADEMGTRLPLAGVRVLDAATFIAAPFCGTILADFGAEVIKIEQPGIGDSLRRLGTPTDCGDSLLWMSEARNKKSVTLDLKSGDGAEIFRDLVRRSDIVLENFRPGTLEKWGLGFEALRAINPKLIMLRISAYGQTGPKSSELGFARIAHGFGGLTALSGEPGRPPVVPGSTSLADYISGMWGAIGVLLALRSSEATETGQFIDIGLYESIFRLLDDLAPTYAQDKYVRERMGADTVNAVPHSHYRTSDGYWIALACTNDKMFRRLAVLMARPELGDDPNYATAQERIARREEVNDIVQNWVGSHPRAEILDLCEKGEVPCGPIYTIDDIFKDAQYKARGNLVSFEDPRAGALVLPAALPTMSETPARLRHAGRALGADNQEVYGSFLGISQSRLDALASKGVI